MNKAESKEKAKDLKYSKKDLMVRFKNSRYRDIINVLLEDEGTYTFAEVDELIEKFKKGKVN